MREKNKVGGSVVAGSPKKTWDAETRARYERALQRIDDQFKPVLDAIEESERITADDLSIRINDRNP